MVKVPQQLLLFAYLEAKFKVFSAPNPEALIVPAQFFKPGPIDSKKATYNILTKLTVHAFIDSN